MHLTGPLQTAIIIIYVLLMVTKTLHSTENMSKLVSASANSTTKTTAILKPRSVSQKQPAIADIRRIFSSLRSARKSMKQQSSIIQEFYANVKSVLSGIFVYEWLPKDHLHWFENKVRHFDKHKKVSVLIPVLYDSLKTFMDTFCEMLKFDSEGQHVAHSTVYKKRVKILRKIVKHLNLTYSEVETDVIRFHMKSDAAVNLTRVEKGSNWDPKPDHTTAMVQDWGVITTYNKFLKDWVQIARHMYEVFCKEHKRTHRCYAYLNKTSSVR